MPDLITRSNKLASAVYLVTSFFGDQEPLKWRLRALATELVSEKVKDKTTTAAEMLACFHLAKNANMVSEANNEILVRELSKFKEELEKPIKLSLFPELPTLEKFSSMLPKTETIKDNIVREAREEKRIEERPKLLQDFGAVSVKKNSRQSIIISLLKRKKEIMIKDVSPLISGCSEKTIQRELLAMVQAGILKKTGEKRWSRYSLA